MKEIVQCESYKLNMEKKKASVISEVKFLTTRWDYPLTNIELEKLTN